MVKPLRRRRDLERGDAVLARDKRNRQSPARDISAAANSPTGLSDLTDRNARVRSERAMGGGPAVGGAAGGAAVFDPAAGLGVDIADPRAELAARNQRTARPQSYDPSAGVTPNASDFNRPTPQRLLENRIAPTVVNPRGGAREYRFGDRAGTGQVTGPTQAPGPGQSLDIGAGQYSTTLQGPTPEPVADETAVAGSGTQGGIRRMPDGSFSNVGEGGVPIEQLDIGAPGRGGFTTGGIRPQRPGRAASGQAAVGSRARGGSGVTVVGGEGTFNPVTRERETDFDRQQDQVRRAIGDLRFRMQRAVATGNADDVPAIAQQIAALNEVGGAVRQQDIAAQGGVDRAQALARGEVDATRIQANSPANVGAGARDIAAAEGMNFETGRARLIQNLRTQMATAESPAERERIRSRLQDLAPGEPRDPVSAQVIVGYDEMNNPILADAAFEPGTGRRYGGDTTGGAREQFLWQRALQINPDNPQEAYIELRGESENPTGEVRDTLLEGDKAAARKRLRDIGIRNPSKEQVLNEIRRSDMSPIWSE